MRTDALLRRIEGLDRDTLATAQRAGWVTPETLAAGDDPRWWSERDVNKLRDIVRLRRRGMSLEEAYREAREDAFFGLCPCDWR